MKCKRKTAGKITGAVLIILLLLCCLGMTAYALFYVTVKVEDNYFQTGIVDIELLYGEKKNEKQIIKEDEYLFEPGMTVEKTFWVKNKSTCDVYYRLYFENVEGDLADVLEVRIWDADSGQEYFSGSANEFEKSQMGAADEILREGKDRKMKISFHHPETSGNTSQNKEMSFELGAEAVQTKNNPDKLFE